MQSRSALYQRIRTLNSLLEGFAPTTTSTCFCPHLSIGSCMPLAALFPNSPSQLAHHIHSFPPTSYSTGKSMPTLLALNLTLSSSLIPMPGLYRSISARYVRCACTYCANCSACWIWDCVFAAGLVTVSRMRFCSVEGVDSFWWVVRVGVVLAGMGSSRSRRR